MVSSMVGKAEAGAAKGVAVIGSSVAAIQAALTLAQLGVQVKLIAASPALGWTETSEGKSAGASPDLRYFWPLLLRTVNHPLVTLYCHSEIEQISGDKGDFKIAVRQNPHYINPELCTGCGGCQAECSVRLTSLVGERKVKHGAIHPPIIGMKSVPSAYMIDKNSNPPCRVACPLGINVQGFVSLLSKGKVDKALALINDTAPFAGILGRVCRHPCEGKCNRSRVDEAVSIRNLHRYPADNSPGGVKYTRKAPARSREGKIAIVGSGPAGLTAAWELTRRGYTPTVFESHGVVGGMLATGIPRFRLPREVREKEIEAIKKLGVDIRTGISVGRDVTFAYLKERGYQSFFLAIGAQKNNRLNIPGEDLKGVVDCISLLLTLNLKVDTFTGANVVVIGDGNSAVDSARASIRRSRVAVKLLCWTTSEEVTAGEDELGEALQEGVTAEYNTSPVELLGENGEVTGIRCCHTRLTDRLMANGRHLPEPIPGTDFVIPADHVVVAIGQSPNAAQLDIDSLAVNARDGTIKVNPLTMETSIKGVFAGGDCISGPNNVVAAMAAGLRAAEFIDRYFRGIDLGAGRSLEPLPVCEIDINKVEASPCKRAHMPTISLKRRMESYEETTRGLSATIAKREAERCLNCALCSRCLECVVTCKLGAVNHDDATRSFEIGAELVLRFNGDTEYKADWIDGVRVIPQDKGDDWRDQLAGAAAVAIETSIELGPDGNGKQPAPDLEEENARPALLPEQAGGEKRLGVFLCRCGGSNNAVVDFKSVTRRVAALPGVVGVREVVQACTEDGAREIAAKVAEWGVNDIVLAACRCCNLEQVCYSCTDRRQMCQQLMKKFLPLHGTTEFCNIREQCAHVHQDDPKGATRKAAGLVSAAVARARLTPPPASGKQPVTRGALVVGGGPASLNAARALTSRGYQVYLVTRQVSGVISQQGDNGKELAVRAWPESLGIHGSPGCYEVELIHGPSYEGARVGAILLDMNDLAEGGLDVFGNDPESRLLGRLASWWKGPVFPLHSLTIGETAGVFVIQRSSTGVPEEQAKLGLATAARVSAFLEQPFISPRETAVEVDSKTCRGCGDCAGICPYIRMQPREGGLPVARIDSALCLGCGACVSICPAGAISQPRQTDAQLISALQNMLQTTRAGARSEE